MTAAPAPDGKMWQETDRTALERKELLLRENKAAYGAKLQAPYILMTRQYCPCAIDIVILMFYVNWANMIAEILARYNILPMPICLRCFASGNTDHAVLLQVLDNPADIPLAAVCGRLFPVFN